MGSLHLNPDLLKAQLYVTGKSAEEVQAEYGVQEVVKLGSNENPLGPSPLAIEALKRALPEAHRYPGVAEQDLRRRLGFLSHAGFGERHVLIGNGATDLIRTIAQAFLFAGGEMVTSRVTFPLYPISATVFGGTPVLVAPGPELRFDLAALAASVGPKTRLVFLCSPNNPTGLILSSGEVDAFVSRMPEHVVVVIDESYRDFVEEADYPDSADYVARGRNVIALRSFSKGAGLANLRVGYAISTPEIVDYLHRAQLPFHTGAPALAAARASLDDREHAERTRALVRHGREFLYAALEALEVTYLRSQANFVLLPALPLAARTVSEHLLRNGVIVRPMEGWGLPNAIRVSVGTREQNERFVAALAKVFQEAMGQHR